MIGFARTLACIGATWLLCWASATQAYKIAPSLAIHEAMTALAENCVESYRGVEPYDCSAYYPDHLRYFAHLDYSNPVYNLSVATRWPDDPQRMTRGLGYVRFGLVFLSCGSRIERSAGVDDGGLLCSSHFGPLQFFHAMAASPAMATAKNAGETATLMLQWTAFTFGLASGAIDHQRNYCAYFAERNDALADAMWHEGFRFCGDGTDGQAPGKWTVGTPFLLRCASLISPCRETLWDAGRREVRVAAMGALLHMVQDSYSQSHAMRGPVSDSGYEARIVCEPVTRFYDFNGQDGHGDADRLPVFDRDTCGNPETRPVDDPITASARLLWMLAEGQPTDRAAAYVRTRVLGMRPLG